MELVTAMFIVAVVGALAFAFYRDFGKALREGWHRFRFRQDEIAFTASLQRGFMEGRGLTRVSSDALVFLARGGASMRLEKGPEGWQWNGKPFPLPVAELALAVEGPDCPSEPGASQDDPACRALLDSLDGDRDGVVDMAEMDRDGDGVLQGRERRPIRVVSLRWRDREEGPWRGLSLHPRKLDPDTAEDGNFP